MYIFSILSFSFFLKKQLISIKKPLGVRFYEVLTLYMFSLSTDLFIVKIVMDVYFRFVTTCS